MQNLEIPIAKKRGRKPKSAVSSEAQQIQLSPKPVLDTNANTVHKKRGRKPKQKDPVL